jgi:hypothetical protein
VHDIYASVLRRHKNSEGHAALQQQLQEARWFIKNIQQRFDTILRVSEAIVERQKNFLCMARLAMRPLVLRDIADTGPARVHHQPRDHGQVHGHAQAPSSSSISSARPGHGNRRQCLQHGRACADQAVCRCRRCQEAAVGRQLADMLGAGH